MTFRMISAAISVFLLASCGGGGGDNSPLTGGVDENDQAGFSEENFIFAANSFAFLEDPIFLTGLVVSSLHQLDASDGETQLECEFVSYDDPTGTVSASLSGSTLELAFDNCRTDNMGTLDGRLSADFSQLERNGHYLLLQSEMRTQDLTYFEDGVEISVDFSAAFSQQLTGAHSLKQNIQLIGNEALTYNGVPFFFKNSQVTKDLDYNLGRYDFYAYADISIPDAFDGSMQLETTTPLTGQINYYPEQGTIAIKGGFGHQLTITADPIITDEVILTLDLGGESYQDYTFWSQVLTGPVIQFPPRQGISHGAITVFEPDPEQPKPYYEQSPKADYAATLQPEFTFLVMPSIADSNNIEVRLENSYLSYEYSEDYYRLAVDGPWVTLTVEKDLDVDHPHGLYLLHDGLYEVGNAQFDTYIDSDIELTEDQHITESSLFTLGPINVQNEQLSFTIDWQQTAGDVSIDLLPLDDQQVQLDPTQMTQGKLYRFSATIHDELGREFQEEVLLINAIDTNKRSFVRVQTDSAYSSSPNTEEYFVTEVRSANIDDGSFEFEGEYPQWSFTAYGLNDAAVNRTVSFSTPNGYWSTCNGEGMQYQVHDFEWVDLGINEEGRLEQELRLAFDFSFECDGGSLHGEIRVNSDIE